MKYNKWAPKFNKRLQQSKDTTDAMRLTARGFSLYHIYEEVESKMFSDPYRGYPHSGWADKIVFMEKEYQGAKWLKKKHVTLLRMQGKIVSEAPKKAYNPASVDIERN
jgi:hypothetical protein